MKNIIITTICIFFFVIACNKEEDKPTFESKLSINELKDYLPAAYKNETGIVYKNEEGELKHLKIKYLEGTKTRTENSPTNYQADFFEITLFDPADLYFRIVILGNTNYSNSGNITKSIHVALMPFNESGNSSLGITFEDGMPKVRPGDDFREEVILNNRVFKDVFIGVLTQLGEPIYDAYSEVDVNSEFGVVAFRDHNNDLWVFDRFDE